MNESPGEIFEKLKNHIFVILLHYAEMFYEFINHCRWACKTEVYLLSYKEMIVLVGNCWQQYFVGMKF